VAFRIVVILREDFFAQLLPIVDELADQLPGIHRQKFRLLPLTRECAREVIVNPAVRNGGEPPDEPAIHKILDRAGRREDGLIEPTTLAVLLEVLERERKTLKAPRITADLAEKENAELFAGLVDDAFKRLPPENRATARLFVEEKLVSNKGYRESVTVADANDMGISEESLKILEESKLIVPRRTSPERYELSHDRLCPTLSASRRLREREKRENKQRARMRRSMVWSAVLAALVGTSLGATSIIRNNLKAATAFKKTRDERSHLLATRAASAILSHEAVGTGMALHLAAAALKLNPKNDGAARLARQLLLTKRWCLPVTEPYWKSGTYCAAASFTPDGDLVAVVLRSGRVQMFNWAKGWRQVGADLQLSDAMEARSRSEPPDRPREGESRAASLPNSAELKADSVVDASIQTAVFSPDGKRLLAGFAGGGAASFLWSKDHYELEYPAETFNDTWLVEASWSPDGKLVVVTSWSQDGSIVHFYREKENKLVECFEARSKERIYSAADLSPNGTTVAAVTIQGKLDLLNAATLQEEKQDLVSVFPRSRASTRAFLLRYGPDEKEIAVVPTFGGGAPVVWNLASGKSMPLGDPRVTQVMQVAFGNYENNGICLFESTIGMLKVFRHGDLESPYFEPVTILGSQYIVPALQTKGEYFLTLSGPSAMYLDTLRVWKPGGGKPGSDSSGDSADDPPPWFADLADYVSARASDDGLTAPATLKQIRKAHEGFPSAGRYAEIWKRLISD
jgi:hypothetical protein